MHDKYLSLTNIDIPNGVTSIEAYALLFCESLTNIHIPNSVTSIGDSAFYLCDNLYEINIPDGVKNIKAKSAEEAAIGLLLLREEYRGLAASGKVALSRDDFTSEFYGRAFEKVIELERADQYDFSLLGQFFSPDEMGRLQGLEQKRRVLTENGKAVFEQCVETVKTEKQLSVGKDDSGIDAIRRLLDHKRGGNK